MNESEDTRVEKQEKEKKILVEKIYVNWWGAVYLFLVWEHFAMKQEGGRVDRRSIALHQNRYRSYG